MDSFDNCTLLTTVSVAVAPTDGASDFANASGEAFERDINSLLSVPGPAVGDINVDVPINDDQPYHQANGYCIIA